MPTDIERLVVRIEATQRQFEKQLKNANRTANRSAQSIEKRFNKMNKSVSASSALAGRSINRLLLGVGTALSVREVTNYADAWTSAGNKIRAASQITNVQTRSLSDLNNIATETRSGLEETVDLYARLLRSAAPLGKTELEVATATEIATKAFKAGGAAASEQASGILQLGQALGSGFLQGDELRSLRENAPLIAQAIADEFKTTIGGLKQLGAEGKLTSDRVFNAIINGQSKIEAAFAVTDKTIGEGFTLAKNAVIELVGAFDNGARGSEGIGNSLANLSVFLNESTEAAKRFGAQFAEALKVVGEVAGTAGDALNNVGLGFDDTVQALGEGFRNLIEGIKLLIATATGASEALSQAFLNAVAAVGNGGAAIANAAISAVESIINGIISGLQNVVKAINKVISSANSVNPFSDVPTITIPLKAEFERFQGDFGANNIGVADAFKGEFERVKGVLDDGERDIQNAFSRISTASGRLNGGEKQAEEFVNSLPGAPSKSDRGVKATPSAVSGGASKSANKVQKFIQDTHSETQALRDQIAAIGLAGQELAKTEARQAAYNKLKQQGIKITPELTAIIEREAEAVANLTEQLENGEISQERFMTAVDGVADSLAGALVAGESLKDGLRSVFQGIATDILSSGIKKAILGQFPSGGGGGGLLGGLLGGSGGFLGGVGKILGFEDGGFTGTGGKSEPKGVVHGGEFVFSKRATQKAGVANLEALHNNLRGFENGGFVGNVPNVSRPPASLSQRHVIDLRVTGNGVGIEQVGTISREISEIVSLQIVEQNNKRVPSIVSEAQGRT